MRRTRPGATSGRVRQAQAGIEKWRKTRKKRSPMPAALWDAAVELAQSDGVYPISRALKLNYQSLQCRVSIASSATRPWTGAPRGFVELSSPLPIALSASPAGPVLELSDHQRGFRAGGRHRHGATSRGHKAETMLLPTI